MAGAWKRLTLRARLVIIGVFGLVLTLAIGGVTLVWALQYALMNSADAGAEQTASDVADLIATGKLPDPIPASGSSIVQVLGPEGKIWRVSTGTDGLVPLLRPWELEKALAGKKLTVSGERSSLDGSMRVHAIQTTAGGATYTVIVAVPLTQMHHSLGFFKTGLLLTIPVLTVLLGLLTWSMVGAALRPVESLRRGAETVRGGERLPVPRSTDEVHRLAVTLNTMLDRLEHARLRQRAFVADAAHELRSPLANMRTELEVAARIGPTPELLDDLLSDVERLGRLTDDLLLLARADDPEVLRRKAERIDVAELLTAVTQRYSGCRVPVTFTDPDVSLYVDGDVDALRRAVGNLIDNGVRHAETYVHVTLGKDGDGVRIGVNDDGPGIPAADRERVFERFTRLDDARSRDRGGTGLGLAIVRDLVGRHGGSVALRDTVPGGERPGLRADIWLPASVS